MSFVSHVLFLQSQNVGCEKDLILQYIFKEVESYFELLDAKVQFIACSLKLSILLISFHFLYIFFSYFLCNCMVSLNLYAFTSKSANAAVGIKHRFWLCAMNLQSSSHLQLTELMELILYLLIKDVFFNSQRSLGGRNLIFPQTT